MRSIRARTLLLVLGVLSISLTLISWKSYLDARHEIEEIFDAALAQSSRLLAGMVSRERGDPTLETMQSALDRAAVFRNSDDDGEEAQRLGHKYESKLVFVVFDREGRALLHSASAPLAALDPKTLADAAAAVGSGDEPGESLEGVTPGYHDARLSGEQWRLFLLHDDADSLWVLVGERADVRGELAASIALQSLLPDLVGLPLVALLVWLAIGWGLRPLQQMVRMLHARDPDNLAPLLLAPVPDELAPVVASLNRLLLQVTELLDREKRFVAYAAHELRTPLAVLRLQAHNAVQAAEPEDRNDALRQLDRGVARATRVVEQLLTLARLEPGSMALSMKQEDLLGLTRNQLAELIPLALERGQEVTLDADESADFRIAVDRACFSVLLQNLVGNAVRHTPDRGCIRVCLEAHGNAVELCVQDSGPGVPTELRASVFERFFRHGSGQGAGLGLSIAARIAELHRASIGLRDSPLGGLEVFVRFLRTGTLRR